MSRRSSLWHFGDRDFRSAADGGLRPLCSGASEIAIPAQPLSGLLLEQAARFRREMVAPIAGHALAEEGVAILGTRSPAPAQRLEAGTADAGGENFRPRGCSQECEDPGQHRARLGRQILVADAETPLRGRFA